MSTATELDVSSFSRELQLMLHILSVERRPEAFSDLPSLVEGISWEEFLRLCERHRVYPWVYAKLNENKFDWVPYEVMTTLERDYKRNAFFMLWLEGELRKICLLFQEHSIRNLILKGPTLSEALYGAKALRTSRDLDFLVPLEDFERTDRLLRREGFIEMDPLPRILNDWKWREHHCAYVHPGKRLHVEIHWRLNHDSVGEPSFNELWERRAVAFTDCPNCYSLGREDLVSYLIAHGARHAWTRLRWLHDIDRLLNHLTDWKAVRMDMNRHGGRTIAGQTFLMVSAFFGSSVPKELQDLILSRRSQKLAEICCGFIEEEAKLKSIRYQGYIRLMLPLRSYILLLVRRFYPSSRDAEVLPLPRAFHFLYFPLRPLLWSLRKLQRTHS